ncbi:uncharacterized protein DFL_000411 [Arthrobotrys flagrans]|uniref:CHAT domain-containing protein n=1 Tax=Arthrobotrys flagrans TaxID=97331 RepID=A0A437AF94_ARTFL|nr:hypothetical protein DFL_000411 [Arthrobotrys flagrans]
MGERVINSTDLYFFYKRTGVTGALDFAITLEEESLGNMAEGDLAVPSHLNNLSVYYGSRFERLGKLEDLEKAIQAAEQAIAATSKDSPNRAACLNSLSNGYSSRFDRLGKLEDLEKAIQAAEQAIAATSKDSPNRAACLNNLSNEYSSRFDRLGKLEDLEKAIQAAEQAVAATPEDSPDIAGRLNNLSNRYSSKFDRFGKLEDLEKAIQAAEQAVAATPEDSPDITSRLNNLSNQYSSKFNRLGKLEDLEKAIQAAEQAVAATPKDNPDIAGRLNNLSNGYSSKFDRLGKLEDLEKAIQAAEQTVAATPEDSPDIAGCLNNLSMHYSSRFNRLGKLEDLEKAIQAAEQAVAATPEDSPNIAGCLNNLSIHYSSRFNRLGKLEDLEKAIQAAEQAVAATPEDSPDIAGRLNNLSIHYSSRFERLGKLEDLEKAIQAAEQAVAATPEDSPDIAGCLNNLSIHYSSRFNRLGKLEDLEKAIQAAEQAVAATPEDSPDIAGCLNNLSNRYSSRFDRLGKLEDLEKAITHVKNAFAVSHVSPLSRIRRGKRLSQLYYHHNDLIGAADAAAHATSLLPRISPRYLPRRDHEYILSQANGLSSFACSLALRAGKPAAEAFELIEIGRAVMASFAIDLQTDVLNIREHNPCLYKRYESLRYRFSAVPSDETFIFSGNKPPKSDREERFHIERELTEVEDQIRRIPEFARFQLPPDVEDLKRMANEGPLVAFNVTDIRSDALIITSAGVRALPLENLDLSEAERMITGIGKITNRHPLKLAENNKQMKAFLRWLWLVAVKPVLGELGFLGRTPLRDSELPRIWWITNGIMGSAPLHAAGLHGDSDGGNDTEIAMDFVVSSYISTAKALKFARNKLQQSGIEVKEEALLISAHDEDFDFESEVQAIAGVIGRHYRTVSLKDGSKEEVLRHIERSSIIHFSCHGISVNFEPSSEPPKSPSDSYLLLRGSQETPNERLDEKLTVDDLTKVRHPRAQLAFLSACSTAKISAEQLKDEMVHIANAFQLAGYPHVVGTLWEAEDESAAIVSKAFYESLFEGEPRNIHRSVATALHQATRKLMRDSWFGEDYLAWAPFVHIGA